MSARRYAVLLISDSQIGGYTVTVPALPGCITEGESIDEALANAEEAIQCHVQGLQLGGLPVPEERP